MPKNEKPALRYPFSHKAVKRRHVADLNDSIASAQAAVDVAQRNYESLQRLADKQAATKLQVQDAKDALDRAHLHLYGSERSKTNAGYGDRPSVAEAKLRNARSAVALAQHKLRLATVSAPSLAFFINSI